MQTPWKLAREDRGSGSMLGRRTRFLKTSCASGSQSEFIPTPMLIRKEALFEGFGRIVPDHLPDWADLGRLTVRRLTASE